MINFFNTLWGLLAIVAQILSLILIVSLFVPGLKKTAFVTFFKNHGLLMTFIISLLATSGSLIYSDVIGYEPCRLCWYQRILMYPQVILLGLALFRKDKWISLYGLFLSLIGGAIALFHYSGQIGLAPLPCSAVGVSVSCAQRFVFQFGYITIPMMAFSAFLLMAIIFVINIRND